MYFSGPDGMCGQTEERLESLDKAGAQNLLGQFSKKKEQR